MPILVVWSLVFLLLGVQSGFSVVLYHTGFEASEGYHTNLDLSGQQLWTGQSGGGNGVVSGWFPGKGQQAYVGFSPPTNGDTGVFVYPPLDKNVSQAQLSVTMMIENSSNTNWDDFYWAAYDQHGQELFTLDFDNYELKLYYHLGGATNRMWSGLKFTNDVIYGLSMALDFDANRWSAVFNGALVATNQPITTNGASLNLGDFDAAWAIYDPDLPGDNFMLFDDYQVSGSVPPPDLNLLGLINGAATLRLTGRDANSFAVEASSSLTGWQPVKTNITSGGSFDYVDTAAQGASPRFYRARWVP
ncbi:MAG TPA: hypothetical protein VFE51_15115 [Verrucomicrobiae bacterium]|nr:hypothetical protein [Verrucomicrobiae bacterium]